MKQSFLYFPPNPDPNKPELQREIASLRSFVCEDEFKAGFG
jgi:hypothetical protein